MASELSEILNTINLSKENLLSGENGEIWEKSYQPFVVNHCLMPFMDTILVVNELNVRPHCDKKMQYEFLLNMVTPRKRFAKWLKPAEIENLEVVKEYYGYGDRKAREALSILTDDEVESMRAVLDKGGRKRK